MNEITENDLRLPEFRGVKIEELERRSDGVIVRKDRWETGIRKIASILGCNEFEIDEVVECVRELVKNNPA